MNNKTTSRIAIFLPNWVGDVVMATPALRAIRQHFGQRAELIGVMRQHVQDVLSGSDMIGHVILYDRRAQDARQHCLSVVRELRRRQIDEIFLLTNSFRAAAMAWLSGVRKRVGYARYGRGYLLSHRLHPPRAALELLPVSPVDYYLRIAAAAGAAPVDRQPRLATDENDEQAAELVWERFGWSRFEPVVTVNTGGAYGAAKRWPNQHFAQLALRIVSERSAKVLVICGPAERDAARDIVRRARHPHVQSLADEELCIGLSKACVRRSDLLVTTDSGPRHFAAAFGVPAITLFGPTDPRWSENYGPQSVHLMHKLPCGPCARRACPLGHHRCMNDLSPDRVYQAVQRLLAPDAKATANIADAVRAIATEG